MAAAAAEMRPSNCTNVGATAPIVVSEFSQPVGALRAPSTVCSPVEGQTATTGVGGAQSRAPVDPHVLRGFTVCDGTGVGPDGYKDGAVRMDRDGWPWL